MKTKNLLLLLPLLLSVPALPAHAQEDRLQGSVGWFDAFDNDNDAADFRGEYRWGNPVLWEIKPFIGAEGTTDGAVYGLGGVYADFNFAEHLYLTPSVGGGLYIHGDGKDLGDALEFRTQLELSYEFENTHRVGVSYSHISNWGLGDHDPGTDVMSLSYSIPFSGL